MCKQLPVLNFHSLQSFLIAILTDQMGAHDGIGQTRVGIGGMLFLM